MFLATHPLSRWCRQAVELADLSLWASVLADLLRWSRSIQSKFMIRALLGMLSVAASVVETFSSVPSLWELWDASLIAYH